MLVLGPGGSAPSTGSIQLACADIKPRMSRHQRDAMQAEWTGVDHLFSAALMQSMQQTWTILQQNGPKTPRGCGKVTHRGAVAQVGPDEDAGRGPD